MARLPLLLAALAACLAASRASQWDPHSPSGLGFEGWFLRLTVTSLDAGSSAGRRAPTALTVIVGGAPAAAANRTLAALAVQTADGAAGATFEQLDLQLSVRVPAGSTVTSPPRMWVTADDGSFAWRVEGDACSLTARLRGAELRAHCEGPPVPWSADGLGPEGRLAYLPAAATGIHWFVHSLATPMRFTLALPAKHGGGGGRATAASGTALGHWEKNWGARFPDAWHWAQGIAASSWASGGGGAAAAGQQLSAFALAGGPPPAAVLPSSWLPDVWLLGVRAPGYSWSFHPYDSVFTSHARPCGHSVELSVSAVQPLARRAVEVSLVARARSFAAVHCPTADGFQPFSEQTATAHATVRLYALEGLALQQRRLLHSFVVDGAALELGGDARCPLQAASEQAQEAQEEAGPVLLPS